MKNSKLMHEGREVEIEIKVGCTGCLFRNLKKVGYKNLRCDMVAADVFEKENNLPPCFSGDGSKIYKYKQNETK